MKSKYIVHLSIEEQKGLEVLVNTGEAPARKLLHARILLKAHEQWGDEAISTALTTSVATVERVRARCVLEGVVAALERAPSTRVYQRKLDGVQEAHLIALACSKAPEGWSRWTMRLLADRMVTLEYVDRVSHETVRQVLRHNEIKPWQKQEWCIPPDANADFVYHMEDVLTVYQLPLDSAIPNVCVDESPVQLVQEKRAALPAEPGRPARYDYQYEQKGSANLFMAFAPLLKWRHVEVTERRTNEDFAYLLRDLSDVHFPEAQRIRLICDQLNTHRLAVLYYVFAPAEAKRLADRFEVHYTPVHGSWLNMAEIEFSVLERQCLNQFIADRTRLAREVAAWEKTRNAKGATVHWRFVTADARIKLKRLYPSI